MKSLFLNLSIFVLLNVTTAMASSASDTVSELCEKRFACVLNAAESYIPVFSDGAANTVPLGLLIKKQLRLKDISKLEVFCVRRGDGVFSFVTEQDLSSVLMQIRQQDNTIQEGYDLRDLPLAVVSFLGYEREQQPSYILKVTGALLPQRQQTPFPQILSSSQSVLETLKGLQESKQTRRR